MAVIAIDFDHTLVDGDVARPYAKEAVNIMREKGHKVIIHSCNKRAWIERVLNNADIRYDHLWVDVGKPICDIYIDDKGYRYLGNWEAELPTILDLVKGLDNRKW